MCKMHQHVPTPQAVMCSHTYFETMQNITGNQGCRQKGLVGSKAPPKNEKGGSNGPFFTYKT